MLLSLAPSPPRAVAPAAPAPTDGAVVPEPAAIPVVPVRPAAPAAPPPSAGDLQEPTPEQTAIIADLHWLIHQGHVIEFANGRIETAKRPIPKPPRPVSRPAVAPTEGAAVAATTPAADTAGTALAESDAASAGAEITEATAPPERADNSVAVATTPEVPAPTPPPAAETDSGSTQVASV